MIDESVKNFGKRKPTQPVYEEPTSRKRSSQIALLLMGTMAVGGGAYALMPGERCDTTQPMTSEERLQCTQRNGTSSSSSGSHGYSGSSGSSWGSLGSSSSSGHSNFASSSSSSSSGLSTASSTSTHVARSGFGSFGSHFSGGG